MKENKKGRRRDKRHLKVKMKRKNDYEICKIYSKEIKDKQRVTTRDHKNSFKGKKDIKGEIKRKQYIIHRHTSIKVSLTDKLYIYDKRRDS